MNGKFIAAFLAFASFYTFGLAQGYAGLGVNADGYSDADPNYIIEFPKDAGAHKDFRVEWWYLTANLEAEDGRKFGIQWTLFRNSVTQEPGDGWQSNQIWMAHAAVTTKDDHVFAEKFARGGVGQAGVQSDPFSAWIDNWEFRLHDNELRLNAGAVEFSIELRLNDQIGPVLQGDNGYSVKSAGGQASHYYSQPYLTANGQVELRGERWRVSGIAWLDREWSSQLLSSDQSGWDWVGLSFADGGRLMAARVRGENDFRFGSLIGADGTMLKLDGSEIRFTPLENTTPPTRWALSVGELDLEIDALNNDAWTGNAFQYWEGPVDVTGDQEGVGYLEMTGYR